MTAMKETQLRFSRSVPLEVILAVLSGVRPGAFRPVVRTVPTVASWSLGSSARLCGAVRGRAGQRGAVRDSAGQRGTEYAVCIASWSRVLRGPMGRWCGPCAVPQVCRGPGRSVVRGLAGGVWSWSPDVGFSRPRWCGAARGLFWSVGWGVVNRGGVGRFGGPAGDLGGAWGGGQSQVVPVVEAGTVAARAEAESQVVPSVEAGGVSQVVPLSPVGAASQVVPEPAARMWVVDVASQVVPATGEGASQVVPVPAEIRERSRRKWRR